jgi:hypothetical protein
MFAEIQTFSIQEALPVVPFYLLLARRKKQAYSRLAQQLDCGCDTM